MNYWSVNKANCPLLLWFSYIFWLGLLDVMYSQIWHSAFFPQFFPQHNWISVFLSLFTASQLQANNIIKDLLTPSCLDVFSDLWIRFPPPSQTKHLFPCVCFAQQSEAKLGGCSCQMTLEQNAHHIATPSPHLRQLTGLNNCGRLFFSRRSGEKDWGLGSFSHVKVFASWPWHILAYCISQCWTLGSVPPFS